MAKISIIAKVKNSKGVFVYAQAYIDAELEWYPMNVGNGPIETDMLPPILLELNVSTKQGHLRWPAYRDPSLAEEIHGTGIVWDGSSIEGPVTEREAIPGIDP